MRERIDLIEEGLERGSFHRIRVSLDEPTSESIDIVMNAPDGSSMEAHFNSLQGDVGVANYGGASIGATANWWGCPKGPGAPACSTVVNADGGMVTVEPALTKPFKE